MKFFTHIFILFASVLLINTASAQYIVKAEYFFDTDPGVGLGTAITLTPADSVDITVNISTTGLASGFHNLFIRTMDSTNTWSLYEGRNFYIYPTPVVASSTQLVKAEYFFDTDPGVGLGTAITTGSAADSVDVLTTMSTTGLTSGFHNLFIRTLNASGRWSLYEGRNFYIYPTASVAVAPQLTNAEYFFDTDPGVGNGTAITTGTADSVDILTTMPTTGLSSGFHNLFIRTINANGKWSLYEGRNFYIYPPAPATALSQIVKAEYFFDTDPGVGNGTAVSPSFATADSVDVFDTIPTTGLGAGFHNLFYRTYNASGRWSLYEGRTFYINPAPASTVNPIVKAEYFFDTDPGVGNGTAVSPSFATADSIDVTTSISAVGLGLGNHNLFIRTKNQQGKWSLYEGRTFTVCSVIPTFSLGNDTTLCGTSLTLNAQNPGSTYLWSTSATTQTINVSSTGTYWAMATAATGCSSSDTIQVISSVVPSMTSANTATICSGQTAIISLTSSAPSTYTWVAADNPNTTGESITPQTGATLGNTIINTSIVPQTVTYIVTPTSSVGGCVGADQTITIIVKPAPAMTSASSAVICNGTAVTIPFASNIASSYQWIAANNANTIGESTTMQFTATLLNTLINFVSTQQTVSYTVTPTSTLYGCVGASQTVLVSVTPTPTMTSSNADTICSGSTINISFSVNVPSTYIWDAIDNANTTGESITPQSSSSIINTITSTSALTQDVYYSVTPTSIGGLCVGNTQTVDITIHPAIAVNAGADQLLCMYDTLYLPGHGSNGTGALSYSWTDGTTTYPTDSIYIFHDSVAHTYTLTVMDSLGCTNTDNAVISFNPNTDIYGLLTSTTLGTIQYGFVELYFWETYNVHFTKVDSVGLDASSYYYHFPNVNHGIYLIKAFADNTAIYPDKAMPSYYDTIAPPTVLWDYALQTTHGCASPDTLNVQMKLNDPATGLGHIQGIVKEGLSYRNQGEPIPGLDVKLGHNPGGQGAIIYSTTTQPGGFVDSGMYYFDSVPVGIYQVYVDIPGLGRVAMYDSVQITGADTYINLDYCADSAHIDTCRGTTVPISDFGLAISDLVVYPNPASNSITIELPSTNNYLLSTIKIEDMLGQTVKELIIDNGKLTIDLTGVAKGVYTVVVEGENGKKVKKLVVQ